MGRDGQGRPVYEQRVCLRDPASQATLEARRITIVLEQARKDEERELHILTNLSWKVADAIRVAELYRARWTIEHAFLQ